MPILRERLRKVCEEFYDYEFEFDFSGGCSYGPADPDNPRTQEDMTKAGILGILAHFTPEDTERLIDYIDNDCGSPITDAMPTELQNIHGRCENCRGMREGYSVESEDLAG